MTENLLPPLKNYNLSPATRKRFKTILNGTDENGDELFFLKPYEKETLHKIVTEWLQVLDGKQTLLRNIVHQLTGQATNQQVEETNRHKIYNAIQQHILKYKAMPSQQQVAMQTGISRQTVAKHIQVQFNNTDEFIAQYNYAAKALLDIMLYDAMHHRNILAARYYLNALHKINTATPQPAQITIGNTTITQQLANELTAEQVKAIEEILNNSPDSDNVLHTRML
ncbi:MAG TPA: hypothetical protein PLW44_06360 [Chitinophagales bacterium]|nr:hypothetical protein [Chitinophagales bacterium]